MVFIQPITFFHLFYTSLFTFKCLWLLFLRDSSLRKRPFIAAHFRSSLHIFVHHCTLKQAPHPIPYRTHLSFSFFFLCLSLYLSVCLSTLPLHPSFASSS